MKWINDIPIAMDMNVLYQSNDPYAIRLRRTLHFHPLNAWAIANGRNLSDRLYSKSKVLQMEKWMHWKDIVEGFND